MQDAGNEPVAATERVGLAVDAACLSLDHDSMYTPERVRALIHAALLGLDAGRLPLIQASLERGRWPLTPEGLEAIAHTADGQLTADEVAERFGVSALPPRAWVGHIERRARLAA